MGSGGILRQISPLLILGISAVALLGPWLPGHEWVDRNLGPGFLLGAAVALLALYVLLLWGEMLRLNAMVTALLKTIQDARAQGGSGRDADRHRLEAVRLLIPALESKDAAVRRSSRENLARLVGRDLGAAPGPWSEWADAQASRIGNGGAK